MPSLYSLEANVATFVAHIAASKSPGSRRQGLYHLIRTSVATTMYCTSNVIRSVRPLSLAILAPLTRHVVELYAATARVATINLRKEISAALLPIVYINTGLRTSKVPGDKYIGEVSFSVAELHAILGAFVYEKVKTHGKNTH